MDLLTPCMNHLTPLNDLEPWMGHLRHEWTISHPGLAINPYTLEEPSHAQPWMDPLTTRVYHLTPWFGQYHTLVGPSFALNGLSQTLSRQSYTLSGPSYKVVGLVLHPEWTLSNPEWTIIDPKWTILHTGQTILLSECTISHPSWAILQPGWLICICTIN